MEGVRDSLRLSNKNLKNELHKIDFYCTYNKGLQLHYILNFSLSHMSNRGALATRTAPYRAPITFSASGPSCNPARHPMTWSLRRSRLFQRASGASSKSDDCFQKDSGRIPCRAYAISRKFQNENCLREKRNGNLTKLWDYTVSTILPTNRLPWAEYCCH